MSGCEKQWKNDNCWSLERAGQLMVETMSREQGQIEKHSGEKKSYSK